MEKSMNTNVIWNNNTTTNYTIIGDNDHSIYFINTISITPNEVLVCYSRYNYINTHCLYTQILTISNNPITPPKQWSFIYLKPDYI